MFPNDIEILKYTDIEDLVYYHDNLDTFINSFSPVTKRYLSIITFMSRKLQRGKTQQLPIKYQKAVRRVLGVLSEEEKTKIKSIPEEELFVHTTEYIGLVKKHWGLWENGSLIYRARYAISVNGIAARVFREVWQRLQEGK